MTKRSNTEIHTHSLLSPIFLFPLFLKNSKLYPFRRKPGNSCGFELASTQYGNRWEAVLLCSAASGTAQNRTTPYEEVIFDSGTI